MYGLMGCGEEGLSCKEKGDPGYAVNRWGINDLQMERNLTGGLPVIYQGHSANLGPFRECFSPAHESRSERGDGCVRESRNPIRTTKRTGGTRTDASFEKHADEMQMMTWQDATRKQTTWQRQRVNGRHMAHRIRGVTILLH